MTSLPVYHAASYVSSIGFGATVTFNSVVIFLTVFHTKKIDKSYKILIITFFLLCIIFSIIEMLVHPFYHSYDGSLINFNMAKWDSVPREWITVMVATYSAVYATIVSFFAVLFVYRYWTMLSSPLLRVFTGWKVSFLVLYAFFFGSFCEFVCLYFGNIDEFSQDYLRDFMEEHYHLDMNHTSGYAIVAYDQLGHLRWHSFFFTLGNISLLAVQFTVMGYCGFQIHWKMNDMLKNVSESHRKLQQQFFKSLVLQITSPTLTFYIPAVLIITVPFLNFRFSFASGLIVCSFSIYPPIDSLILMVVVTEYRRAIKKIIKKTYTMLGTTTSVSHSGFIVSDIRQSNTTWNKSSFCCLC